MALSADGHTLYPMLEGPVAEDTAAGLGADLRIFEVKVRRNGAEFTDKVRRYRLEFPTDSIGDLIAVNDHSVDIVDPQTLVVLNDNNFPGTGAAARSRTRTSCFSSASTSRSTWPGA
jgi:hypothetical protein